MTAIAKRMHKQPDRPKGRQGPGKPNIPFHKEPQAKKPLWERSESFRFGHHIGVYLRLEPDGTFNFQLRQQVLADCNAAEFAAGIFEGFFSKQGNH